VIGELVATGAAGAALASWGTLNPRSRLFGPVIRHGPRTGRAIYLTFDDGPNPRATPVILDVLERERVPAAFFAVGQHVHLFPEVARLVAARGHEIGNHTWSHVKLHRHGPRRIRQELRSCHRTIREQTGVTPRFFRAPHGYRNPWVGVVTSTLGYRTVAWDVGVWDTANPGAEVIRERVRRALQPGAIVLLHDGDGYNPEGNRMQTAAALPRIIRDARKAGYEFRPLAELLP
jgi:peptidoglycan/xylan/chitin deacetylase (PgdA/CDA1 family)